MSKKKSKGKQKQEAAQIPPGSPPTASGAVSGADQGAAALGALVAECAGQGLAVVDYGVMHEGLGNPPPAEHRKLRQNGQIIEHYARDMTVRVAAGAEWGAVQRAMLATGQFVPVDADDDVTVGEAIVHNVYGPLRLGYGGMRDLLLGLHYVDGLGRDIHVGGRTVKNVAGYDVTKLMVGSLGELGVVYEATLRTYAVPEQVIAVDLKLADPVQVDGFVNPLLVSDAAPTWLWMSLHGRAWRLRLAYYGRHSACAAQVRSLETILDGQEDIGMQGSARTTLAQDAAERAAHRRWQRQAPAVVKLVVPPAETGAVCAALASSRDHDPPLCLDALPAHGCIMTGGSLDGAQALRLEARVTRILENFGGLRVWYARPRGAESIRPFGPRQADWPMLVKLKQAMDPKNILNPGRFLSPELLTT
ncbi:MAG: FAD-binding oxidoreductase [Phycisphaeraceae bacterium]|nr:FAD-binding oxidoreductase [Phycisphaeraceae bacterium]